MEIQNQDIEQVNYASFGQRLNAYMIDFLIFMPINEFANDRFFLQKDIGLVIISALLWMLYKTFMEWKWGATIGKRILGLRVQSSIESELSIHQIMVRFIPYFAIGFSKILLFYNLLQIPGFMEAADIESITVYFNELPVLGPMACYLYFLYSVIKIFSSEKKQSLQDQLSNTICISIRR